MGAIRTYPVCSACKAETKRVGLVLLGRCEDTEKITLCLTCACNKVEAACNLLPVDAARDWLNRI